MKPKGYHAKSICMLIVIVTGVFLLPIRALKASAPEQRPWYIWRKVSPCQDTRQDWYSVSQSNPGETGSITVWQQAYGPYATFAEAMTGADAAKMGAGFERDCCHDWAVFMDIDQLGNRKFSAGRIAPDTPNNPGRSNVLYSNLCCEQSFNSAFGTNVGTVRDCRNLQLSNGATVTLRSNGVWEYLAGNSGQMEQSTNLTGTLLTYYQRDSAEQCRSDCESNGYCRGFTFIPAGAYNGTNAAACYLLSAVTGRSAARNYVSGVKGAPGSGGPGRGGGGGRQPGGSGGGGLPGGGGGGGRGGVSSGEKPCTADERAVFARMTGFWKSYRMHITVGGSCEQATGTFKVTEWCEGIDEAYSDTVARVVGTFTGRMSGSSLQVQFQSPPSPHNSAGDKGSSSLYFNSDGTLNLGFSCRGDAKKQ